ncbi:hypothetical protein BSZ32_08210 [Rubritalea profundi]|uniref:Uncharacterized protein n=1 Tax=Rubritalea profundi TaxID=1658618 RepID=A0A2S7U0H8_9BACT|nr:hypothetical protein BSZ32_08210 [Rubritalea profundi]
MFIDLFCLEIVRGSQCLHAISQRFLCSHLQQLVSFQVSFLKTSAHHDLIFAAVVNHTSIGGDLGFLRAIEVRLIQSGW